MLEGTSGILISCFAFFFSCLSVVNYAVVWVISLFGGSDFVGNVVFKHVSSLQDSLLAAHSRSLSVGQRM